MARRAPVGKKTSERKRKPALPRSEPIRSWSTLFGAGVGDEPGRASSAPASASVQRGVELGYRVIDEYVKQGAAMAQGFANGSSPMGATPAPDLGQMTERMLKYASDFASLWFEAMSVMASNRNGVGATSAQAPHNGQQSTSGPIPDGQRFAIQVRAAQPVDVLLTVEPGLPQAVPLVVEPLHTSRGSTSLDGVSVASAEAGSPLRFSLEVPAGTPKGRYTGAILDASTKNPRGRLTVTIHE